MMSHTHHDLMLLFFPCLDVGNGKFVFISPISVANELDECILSLQGFGTRCWSCD